MLPPDHVDAELRCARPREVAIAPEGSVERGCGQERATEGRTEAGLSAGTAAGAGRARHQVE